MAIVDILVPSYKVVHPFAQEALNRMREYSRCKCAEERVAEAFSTGKVDISPLHAPGECPKGKHNIYMPPTQKSCVIHYGRNACLMGRRPEAEYVLFMDDDMVPPADALDRLVAHRKDIVGGICTRRADPPVPNVHWFMDEVQNFGGIEQWDQSLGLMEVDSIGAAFVLLSRKVIEDLAASYHRETYEAMGNGWWFEFMKNPHGHEWGEDVSLSWKAKRLGYSIWADMTLKIGHVGDYIYDLGDYLVNMERIASQTKAAGAQHVYA